MYQRVFFGSSLSGANRSLADLDLRERASLWPLAVAALVMGVWPLYWLNTIEPAVRSALGPLLMQLASR